MQLYDHLLRFPLFQGMSRDNLAQVVGHTRFGFHKYEPMRWIAKEGDKCSQLSFLLAGTIQSTTFSDDHVYSVVEQVEAPFILQPEALFGYYQTYTHAFRALTDCSFVTIEKSEVLRLCEEFLIFRLNLLNFYTTLGQKQLRRYWRNSPTPLTQRISRFLVERCMTPTGQKSFHILMTRLADEVGDSRLDVSRALNQMQYDGLVVLHRGRIEVPQIELLAKNV